MDNALTDAMSKYTAFDGDEAWDQYREKFVRMSAEQRRAELLICDQWVDGHCATPTRESADIWNRRRDLGRWHETLMKAGR